VLQVLLLFHVVQVRSGDVPVPALLAAAVAVAAGVAWVRSSSKASVTAAAAASITAALQVLRGLKLV
jgi:hypothetical protein